MKKSYVKPCMTLMCIEAENGFMSASVYEDPQNTEDLEIKDQQVQGDIFDFSNSDEWNY